MTHRKDWLIYFFSLDRESEIQTKERRSRKVKRKIFSILFALVLVLSFSLVTAVPVGAQGTVPDRVTAITDAADRLVALQNGDGGFMWKLVDGGASGTNVLGVSAMGILETYKLEAKAEYETALARAYKYVVDNPPAFTWNGSKYTESTKGVDSFPDITFLIKLANAADSNPDLLTAIQAQVPGITATDIAALAKSRWDGRVNHFGATIENDPNPTATKMAEYIRDIRHGQPYDALIPWDLEAAVKAALALDNSYLGQGYDQQAIDIAGVINACVDVEPYFSSTDTTQEEYILGLTGAIEAFEETNLYPAKVTELMGLLLNQQQSGGYWNYHGATPADMSVQSTAYAVM
ncbi:MAG: hypothetical protein E3J36_02680, partial [Candidatus Nealsonbacteria bacterium]